MIEKIVKKKCVFCRKKIKSHVHHEGRIIFISDEVDEIEFIIY